MVPAQHSKNIPRIIDWIIFVLILTISYFNSLRKANFAEINIKLPFLNFPIFIGEIALGISIVLIILKWRIEGFSIKRWHYLLGIYLVWLLAKAFTGYFTYGPLAFRTSALFYYPLFAVIAYHIYRKEFFHKNIVLIFLAIIILTKIIRTSMGFTNYTYYALFIVLALKLEKKWMKYCAFAVFLFLFTPKTLFMDSRSYVVGAVASIFFVGIMFLWNLIKNKRWYHIVIGITIFATSMLSLLMMIDKTKYTSILTPSNILAEFNELDRTLVQPKIKNYKQKSIQPELYRKNLFRPARHRQIVMENISGSMRTAMAESKRKIANKRIEIFGDDRTAAPPDPKGDEITQKRDEIIQKKGGSIQDNESLMRREKELQANKILHSMLRKFSDNLEHVIFQHKESLVREIKVTIAEKHSDDVVSLRVRVNKIHQDFIDTFQKKRDQTINEILAVDHASQTQKDLFVKNVNEFYEETKKTLEYHNWILLNRISLGAQRELKDEYANLTFRLFIWRDMIREVIDKRAWGGINFGQPQRSISIEIIGQATNEWTQVGWITPHNSYLHILYRAGVIGFLFIYVIFALFIKCIRNFNMKGFSVGHILCSILLSWLIISSSLLILELPYNAIIFWSLLGITLAYSEPCKEQKETPL